MAETRPYVFQVGIIGMKVSVLWSAALISLLALSGCIGAQSHRQAVRDDSVNKLTAGTVQREIRVGMSAAEVVSVLGSPNMVMTDSKRREVWTYDKVATERVYSHSSGGVSILGLVVGNSAGGAGGLGGSAASGASSTNQRTLTIIIKYDENNLVRDFQYMQSSF